MKCSEILPGDEVIVIEGRYKGKIGLIVSTENSTRKGIIYEVKLPLGSHKTYNKIGYDGPSCSDEMYEKQYTVLTKMRRSTIELVEQPGAEKVSIGRRLLLIREEGKDES